MQLIILCIYCKCKSSRFLAHRTSCRLFHGCGVLYSISPPKPIHEAKLLALNTGLVVWASHIYYLASCPASSSGKHGGGRGGDVCPVSSAHGYLPSSSHTSTTWPRARWARPCLPPASWTRRPPPGRDRAPAPAETLTASCGLDRGRSTPTSCVSSRSTTDSSRRSVVIPTGTSSERRPRKYSEKSAFS